MTITTTTYNPFNFIYQYRYILSFCFLLFLMLKPIIYNSIDQEVLVYELIDQTEKENTSESEIVLDVEGEKTFFYYKLNSLQSNIKHLLSSFELHQSILNFNLEIPFPPPRVYLFKETLYI